MYPKHQQLDSRPAVWRIEQSSIKSKEKKTVAQLWGIGQTEVVKLLQAGRQLLELDNSRTALAGIVHGSILHSQLLTFDIKKLNNVACSVKYVEKENSKANIVSATRLESLPPTTEYFQPNVLRAHMHCCIWKHDDEATPTNIKTNHAWME